MIVNMCGLIPKAMRKSNTKRYRKKKVSIRIQMGVGKKIKPQKC